MKKFLVAIYLVCFLLSCSRKTVPSKPNYSLNDSTKNQAVVTDSVTVVNPVVTDTVKTVTTNSVLVIADGYGRLLTPQQNIPQDAGIKYNTLQLSKGFSAQQLANLKARYNTVPPRVLYVPQQSSSKSLKGDYYIYKKKFWFWKRSDGLFYLDEKYYM
jgi:hypothetical protein